MTNRRTILLWLMIIPALLGIPLLIWPVSASDPRNGMELLFLILGLPVFILNYLEWYAPNILDDMLGKKASTLPTSSPAVNQMKNFLASNPGLQSVALMASLLLIGVVLGAGALTLLDPARGAPAPGQATIPATQSSKINTPQPETILKTVTATATIPPTAITISTQPALVLIDPNLTQDTSLTTTAPTSTLQPVTSTPTVSSGACASSSQAQFDAIQSNVSALNIGYAIKKGYLVKSPDIANMWFFSAKIYGADFLDGVSDPGVWAFTGSLEAPTNIYAINDIAVQYSDYEFGQKASTPVDMQTTGTQTVFDCAAAGN